MRDNERVTQRPTLSEIRAVTQPPEIVNRANSEHWLGIPYFRKVSPYLTRWFIAWGMSPNSVTFVMIAVGASAAAALLVFVDVMKELPVTLVLRPFNTDTLAVMAYQLARDERLGEAALPSLALVLVGLLPVILLSRTLRSPST